jgi:hypothetical protein
MSELHVDRLVVGLRQISEERTKFVSSSASVEGYEMRLVLERSMHRKRDYYCELRREQVHAVFKTLGSSEGITHWRRGCVTCKISPMKILHISARSSGSCVPTRNHADERQARWLQITWL